MRGKSQQHPVAVVNIVVIVIGDIVFDIHTSYNMLIVGNIAAVVIGFIMEFSCSRWIIPEQNVSSLRMMNITIM